MLGGMSGVSAEVSANVAFKTFSSERAVHQCLVVAAVLNGIDDVCLSFLDLGQIGFGAGLHLQVVIGPLAHLPVR